MSGQALILTYHAIEPGGPPLCIEPDLFRAHLDCLLEAGAHTLTVTELAAALSARELGERSVAITFDDGFTSVVSQAAPLLAERGMRATVFCVAGHLGGVNDWPTQPARAAKLSLAGDAELAELARAGFEIGSHGMEHVPLHSAENGTLRRELLESKRTLEQSIGAPVRSFAYPYGVQPNAHARSLVARTYFAACSATVDTVRPDADPLALPRVDAHYLRRPHVFRRVLSGSFGLYLQARRIGASARRAFEKDYSERA